MANVFETIASKCGVHHIKATTYHPHCNGLTERFNATLIGAIATYVNQQQSDYYSHMTRFLSLAKSTARRNITQQQDIYKRRYNTGRQDLPTLKKGHRVLLRQMMTKNLRKFSPKYSGPFRVTRQLSRLNYEVQNIHTNNIETAHVSRIRVIL